jgi:hypothetical protein
MADSSLKGTVIGVGVAGACDEDLGRTQASEQITDPVRNLALVTAEFTVGETEFETTRWRHRQDIKGPMPFTVADRGDLVRCWSRLRRVPAIAPVRGHSHCDRNPTVRFLGYEEATPDGLVVLMRRQNQRSPWKQGIGDGSPRDRLHPPPQSTDRWA